jgi:hypothetical protein
MSRRWVTAVGGAVTCVTAGAAGAAGGQIGDGGMWTWVALVMTLLVGGVATAWVALRTGTADDTGPTPAPPGDAAGKVVHESGTTVGDVTASDGGQAVGVNYGTMTHRVAAQLRGRDAPRRTHRAYAEKGVDANAAGPPRYYGRISIPPASSANPAPLLVCTGSTSSS